MNIDIMIDKLLEAKKNKSISEVVLYDTNRDRYVKFTGFNVDDVGDVELYISVGDEDY